MQVKLVTLDALRSELRNVDRAAFLERYPGAFLLAMGLLAVETIRARRRAVESLRNGARDVTAAVSFGPRLRYDPLSPHPLAGCAFYIKPNGSTRTLRLGRSASCDITVPDPSVSERHCSIEVTDRGVMVTDHDSTNGTTVNLERIPNGGSRVVADEDFLSLGRYSFQFLAAQTLYDELTLLNTLDAQD